MRRAFRCGGVTMLARAEAPPCRLSRRLRCPWELGAAALLVPLRSRNTLSSCAACAARGTAAASCPRTPLLVLLTVSPAPVARRLRRTREAFRTAVTRASQASLRARLPARGGSHTLSIRIAKKGRQTARQTFYQRARAAAAGPTTASPADQAFRQAASLRRRNARSVWNLYWVHACLPRLASGFLEAGKDNAGAIAR